MKNLLHNINVGSCFVKYDIKHLMKQDFLIVDLKVDLGLCML